MQVISNFNQPMIKQEHIKPILKDLYKVIKPYLTWSMFISFGIAWFITNGWCYLLIIIGKGWIRAIALAYAGFLYLPFTIEKPITIWIATRIQKLLFIRRKKKMKKLLLIIFLSVVTLFLVGCANTTSDEEILQQYDFVLGTIKERNNADDGYTYTIEIENEIGLIKSNKLFSIGDTVLLVEVQENKSILIDLD